MDKTKQSKQEWITVDQSIKILNTSRTTLYKSIEKHGIKKKKIKGKTYLLLSDVNLLLSDSEQTVQHEQQNTVTKQAQPSDYLDKLLDEKDNQILFLKQQIEEKNSQINNLIKSREHADIMLNDAQKQIFLLQSGRVEESEATVPEETQKKEKKGFFSTLFRK